MDGCMMRAVIFFNCLSQHFSNDFKICIFKIYWTIARQECYLFTWFKEEANVYTFHGRREPGSILNFNEVSVEYWRKCWSKSFVEFSTDTVWSWGFPVGHALAGFTMFD